MSPAPTLSVIIPTYNRYAQLLATLASLADQTLPADRFEVIVVDDGSADETQSIIYQRFPFALRLVRQRNQGATVARNYGAAHSQADVLAFVDDDVTVSPQTLEALVFACTQGPRRLVMGTLTRRSPDETSVFASIMPTMADATLLALDDVELDFVQCNSELLACRRSDFLTLGMFQDPTLGHGWPNWDDVDFGYRAHLRGFQIVGATRAVAEHWDYSVADWPVTCQRLFRASKSAVWLFQKHPGLKMLIPMLADKMPVDWWQDPPELLARKLVRRALSSPPLLQALIIVVGVIERHFPSPALLRRLYYLLQGAYLTRGYQEGMQAFAHSHAPRAVEPSTSLN